MGPPGVTQNPKGFIFGDENQPILRVLRVQDHYGHAPQDHGPEKERQLPKIINETDSHAGPGQV